MSFLFGSGGSESNLIIPEGEKPKAFQTVIPQKSYKDLAESMGRTETQYNRLLDTRYDMTGTGAQLGAKQRGIEMQEAASYASSLPAASSPDTSFRGTPREFKIKSKDFYEITKRTLAATNEFTKGKVVSILEGGYDLNALKESTEMHLNALIEN